MCLLVHDTWSPIWRSQVVLVARRQGIYFQYGPELGSGIDSKSRVVGVSPLVSEKNHVVSVLLDTILITVMEIYLASGL